MTRILITGSSGLVGRALTKYFSTIEDVEIFTPLRCEMNCLNYAEVIEKFDFIKPDCVVHLAATVGGI